LLFLLNGIDNILLKFVCILSTLPFNTFFFSFSFCDAAEVWQISPQDSATQVMEWMVEFHNFIMCDLILTTGLVVFFLYTCIALFNSSVNKTPITSYTHDSMLEIAWTAYPTIILIGIAFPSFALLYALDDLIDPSLTLKIIGHQWYWSYEYGGSLIDSSSNTLKDINVQFDSYLIANDDLSLGRFRLLEVDNRIKLPIKTHIRLMITSADVLHCWTIPSFGVKVDACPGRLSQASVFIKRCGVYYGQCSELCGVNHGFMPIVVEAIPTTKFVAWLLK
jgi:cytochrome c oxidase subunit 2